MGIVKNALKAIYNALQQPYDPLNPAPDVQAKLEEQGYKFKFNVYAGYRTVIKKFEVTNPQGQPVAGFGADKAATEKYISDYARAAAECKKAAVPEPGKP